MSIKTNLNDAPYFDDYDPTKQYTRILFRPSRALQARELTQLQSILQNQIERFGTNIYKEGTIIEGINFSQVPNLKYVKLTDIINLTGASGETLSLLDLIPRAPTTEEIEASETLTADDAGIIRKYKVVGRTTGLEAEIIQATDGFETRNPDLKTIYVTYLGSAETGGVQTQEFDAGEVLEVSDPDGNDVGTITVTSFEGHTGDSYGVICEDGVVFQRGTFVYVEAQSAVISKYSNSPDQVSVGFDVLERIVTSSEDASLLDNAQGFNNRNAPGADRLKMTPQLVSYAQGEEPDGFFTLMRFERGFAVQIRDVTQFNSIEKEMATRTYDESGDYVVNGLRPSVEKFGDKIYAVVEAGKAYIKGYRVENLAPRYFEVEPTTQLSIKQDQNAGVEYGNYFYVPNIVDNFRIDGTLVSLVNASAQIIGSCSVRNVELDPSGTGYRVYVYNIRKNVGKKSDVVAKIGDSVVSGGLKQANRTAPIVSLGVLGVNSLSDFSFTRRVRLEPTISGSVSTLELNNGTNTQVVEYPGEVASRIVVIDETEQPIEVLGVAPVFDTNVPPQQVGVTVSLASSVQNGTVVYYDERVVNTIPDTKTSMEVYVNTSISSDPSASYRRASLGLPDAYELISVTGFETGKDYTSDFVLHSNQQDGFYDISYIELKSGSTAPTYVNEAQQTLPEAVTVKFKVFKRSSSTGAGYLTIDSYVNLDKGEVPFYVSQNGISYDLSSSVDFRPYAEAFGVNYAISPSSASTAPSYEDMVNNTSAKSVNATVVPANRTFITTDIQHYRSRIDSLIVDSNGEIRYAKGAEADFPQAPTLQDSFTLADIIVPSNPIRVTGPYAVKVDQKRYVKRYTMKDISNFDRRIERLQNVVSVTLLELQTQNKIVLDSNGQSRFKNGFIVDNFKNLKVAAIKDAFWSCGIDKARERLTPSVEQFKVPLKVFGSVNAEEFEDVSTLATTGTRTLLKQPYATSFRNAASNFHMYRGVGRIHPAYDSGYDLIQKPAVNIDVDLETPFVEFVDTLQEIIPLSRTDRETLRRWTDQTQRGNRVTETTRETVRTTTTSLEIGEATETTQRVGEFVTDVQFRPFIESKDVRIVVHGLRPNTIHYVYFDEDNMADHVYAGQAPRTMRRWLDRVRLRGGGWFAARSLRRTNNRELRSDANGTLYAILRIPANTYFVGERAIEISDSSQYNSIKSAGTSYAKFAYNAFNFDVEKTALNVTTRMPEFDTSSVSSTSTNVVGRRTWNVNPPQPPQSSGGDGPVNAIDWNDSFWSDPLAQTFFIRKEMASGGSHLFLSSIDVFFKTKSATKGITLEVREVINGYPSRTVVPFGRVHLESTYNGNDVIYTSDDGQTATTFQFDNPVKLATEKEYAIALIPDGSNPDYTLWTAVVGENDNTLRKAVTQDWGQGVLFTSTNNSAWKSYQNEDLKFTVNAYEFSNTAGHIEYVADDMEFLKLKNIVGRFSPDEIVYNVRGLTHAITISDDYTTATFDNAIGTLPVNEGDYIYITQGNKSHVTRVVLADDNDKFVELADPTDFFGACTARLAVGGIVSHYNYRKGTEVYLKQSSARLTQVFAENNALVGLVSGATAEIDSVIDIDLSYFQPTIQKVDTAETSTNFALYDGSTLHKSISSSDAVYLTDRGRVIESLSNMIVNAEKDPDFRIRVEMSNLGFTSGSPVVDDDISDLNAYRYKLTDTDATSSNYVSSEVILQDDLPASGLKVFADAHRPKGTNINMYVRFKYTENNEEYTDWILLTNKSPDMFTTSVDMEEYREFEFEIPEANEQDFTAFQLRIALTSDRINVVPYVSNYRALAVS